MREELLDLKDLSDSRELMEQQSPNGIRIFLLIMAIILTAAVLWAYFGKLDTYVVALGEIRSDGVAATVSLPSGGKIKEVRCYDGEVVKKGDILYVLDDSYYQAQLKAITRQMNEKRETVANYSRLRTAIQQDNNPFNETKEAEFYYQYEDYRITLNDALQQINNANKQVSNTAEEYSQSATQAQGQADSYTKQKTAYEALYRAISNDTSFSSDDVVVKETYQSYLDSRAKAKITCEQSEAVYQDLLSQTGATDAQLRQAKYDYNTALADYNTVKNNVLSTIASTIADLEIQITTFESDAASYSLKKDSLTYQDNANTCSDKIKNSYYIRISNEVKTLEDEIFLLENQCLEIKNAISKIEIAAAQNGTLVQHQSYAIGDTIGVESTVASIIPDNCGYEVTLYIPESKIAEVEVGQSVEYTFNAIPKAEFGKAYGEINTIAADSVTDESNGQKYYKATASIDNIVLHSKGGENRVLQIGMLTTAHTITGQQRVIVWLLNKLNFR